MLVYHDLLGMMQHPHYVKVTPKFCKQYASVGTVIQEALQSYRDEVRTPSQPTRAMLLTADDLPITRFQS